MWTKTFMTILLIGLPLLFSQMSLAQSAKAYVSLSPAGDFVGLLKATGSAQLAGGKVSAKNIVIDMKSLSTGLELRDDHAKNKYMEVAKYPEAVLVEATGENGKGTGKLRFHGQENPISGTYNVAGGKVLHAEFKIKLSQFGIADINYKGIGVEDEVKIEVQVPITAAGAAPSTVPAGKSAPPKPLKK